MSFKTVMAKPALSSVAPFEPTVTVKFAALGMNALLSSYARITPLSSVTAATPPAEFELSFTLLAVRTPPSVTLTAALPPR